MNEQKNLALICFTKHSSEQKKEALLCLQESLFVSQLLRYNIFIGSNSCGVIKTVLRNFPDTLHLFSN